MTGQHKNRAGLRQTRVYYPFASTHMVNTQLLRVQNVHTKYRKYFRGFLNSRLLKFARNSRKLMYCKYFHFYSNTNYTFTHRHRHSQYKHTQRKQQCMHVLSTEDVKSWEFMNLGVTQPNYMNGPYI